MSNFQCYSSPSTNLQTFQTVTPENCYATGNGIKIATMNEKATASVYALDHHGKPYAHNIDRMTCELTSDSDAKTIEGSIRRIKDNQYYEISYCATSRGRHKLHIKFAH